MTDILFASVPYTAGRSLTMAPALLKGIAVEMGCASVALDLNIEIVDWIDTHPRKSILEDAFNNARINHDLADDFYWVVDHCARRILSYRPRAVGLSLLHVGTQLLTQWLCVHLRALAPDLIIIIGGSGIKNYMEASDNHFCEFMLEQELIDFYITGDGEIALQEWIKGNYSYPGINSRDWLQISDIDNFPYPDYSDYKFDLYSRPEIGLTDSRGCVRDCDFCDVIEHWKRYVYRTADSVFAEMQAQIQRHGITHFAMRNSLTNGNMKEFRRWIQHVAQYNSGRPRVEQISWDGYFIVREKDQHPEEMWETLAQTNPMLILGIESPIQRLRWSMGKRFSDESLDYHLQMAQRYGIDLLLLVIVGSPGETREEFMQTRQWFLDRLHYAKNTVQGVSLTMASVLPNTNWDRRQQELDIQTGNYPVMWIDHGTSITPQERLDNFRILQQICEPFNREQNKLDFEANYNNMITPLIEQTSL